MFNKFKRNGLATILVVFVFMNVVGSLSFARPARAQAAVVVAESIPDKLKMVLDQIWQGIKVVSLNAIVRVATYAVRKVAYDSAVWLASGGKGQTPFAHTSSFGNYLANVADEAAGAGIEELGKSIGAMIGSPNGLNLCRIPDLKIDLNLRMGLRLDYLNPMGSFGAAGAPPPKPNCSLTEFRNNWFNEDSWKSQYGGDVTRHFNATLTTDDSDLGIALDTKVKLDSIIREKQYAEMLQRQEGGGFIGKEGLISQYIKTPAALQAEGFKSITPDKQFAGDQQQLNALLAQGDVKVIAGGALSIFLNTLASTMVKNYQEKGILPFGLGCKESTGNGDCFGNSATGVGSYTATGVVGGREAAQSLFSGFLTAASAISSQNNYDILSDLGNCEGNGIYNCRIDANLTQAIKESDSGVPVTINEALKRQWLHGDWKLIPPGRVADNMDLKNYCAKAYCYSNIKILRQVRILPLGFEIAAAHSNPDKPWTLEQVVKGFNDCDFNRNTEGKIISVKSDPVNKPFCHLIDPNWVLKVPPLRCNSLVYGTTVLSEGAPDRMRECVDISSCVAYNSDGSCKDYGYCAREKNVWDFDNASACDSAYRTCRSFRDTNGRDVAYVARSLDTGFCTKDSVGCRAYSLSQNAKGAWQPIGVPTAANDFANTGIFFNNKLSSSCGANSAGCSAFTIANNDSATLFLKKAPDYLQCYDSDNKKSGTQWPATVAELDGLQPKTGCSQYASVCIPDEVNCSWYTPVTDKGTKIPGRFTPADITGDQITWNDQCDERCVGYAAYREIPTPYSNGDSAAYIIPASGRGCSAPEEGCTSFTNLSATEGDVEKVEHFSYLRACALPNKVTGKTYVTYEGSKVGGYQLKTYILEANDDPANGPLGAPKYFYKTPQDLLQFNTDCTAARYKAGVASLDCREFSD